MNRLKALITPFFVFFIIIFFAFWGYVFIEGWTPLEALYMVVTTVSTVGFREMHELSVAGKVLTMGLIIFGIASAAYIFGKMVEFAVEGHIFGITRRRRMEKRMANMKNHYIICGFGRVGHQVAKELWLEKIPFVVIDEKEETADELEQFNTPFIIGTASAEGLLEKAGVADARGLIAASDSDTENVFVTLTAKSINPKVYVVTRASQTESVGKLKRAGADSVILPYFIAGRRMASVLMRPVAVDFLDTVMYSETVELRVKELKINKGSRLIGKTLEEAEIRQKTGSLILTIKKGNDGFVLTPKADSLMEEDDILIALGTHEQLEALEKI